LIYFASDLHLSPATPGITRLFGEFLAGPARQAQALYLLGDLFEYWAGDDDLGDPFNAGIAQALRQLTAAGVDVGFIAGNRDFLIGEAFAAATGVRLLPDPYVLSLPAWQFVLTHGDALCTEDLPYQAFRAQVRQPAWQRAFLSLPLAERKRQIVAIREKSEAGKKEMAAGAADLMDVSGGSTADFLQSHGYATLIHGHTHRPATHDHIVDGIHCERWVLADWHEGNPPQGEVLAWDGESLRRVVLGPDASQP
jgi:UDP-2,3-diacylglucosamine hydrolase